MAVAAEAHTSGPHHTCALWEQPQAALCDAVPDLSGKGHRTQTLVAAL